MSPLTMTLLGALVRWLLTTVFGYLVVHHILTSTQADAAIAAGVPYLLDHAMIYGPSVAMLAWSLRKKYGARLKLIAAADLPAGASDAQIAAVAKLPLTKGAAFTTLSALLAVGLLGSVGCGATIKTNISPVADIANAGAKIEDSAHAIFVAAQTANATTNQATGQPVLVRAALDDVAIAVNRVGHLGIALKAGLDDYNAAKAAGRDLTAQRAVVQKVLADIGTALADVGHAVPAGTLATIDQAVLTIAGVVTQVKGVMGL